jgi:hypothetical protein
MDSGLIMRYITLTQENGRGRPDRLFWPSLSSSFEKDRRSPKAARALRAFIASERLNFWSIRPSAKSAKNWNPDRVRESRLSFEWRAAGLTAVCFWNAPWRWIMELEGQVRFGSGQALPVPIESE